MNDWRNPHYELEDNDWIERCEREFKAELFIDRTEQTPQFDQDGRGFLMVVRNELHRRRHRRR